MASALAVAAAGGTVTPASAQRAIPLYPGVDTAAVQRHYTSLEQPLDGYRRASAIVDPYLVFFRGEGSHRSPRPAVLICPGGGYQRLSFEKEGTEVARRLANQGVSAAVLMSRLPDESDASAASFPKLEVFADARRGLELLHASAAALRLDTARIGVMGFSAGGHLAMLVSTDTALAVRPAAAALIYPVISMDAAWRHNGSARVLIGADASPATRRAFSGELRVDSLTPPTFLVSTIDDRVVPPRNALAYAGALDEARVPYAIHVFPKGGHGYGMYPHSSAAVWFDLFTDWLKDLGWDF